MRSATALGSVAGAQHPTIQKSLGPPRLAGLVLHLELHHTLHCSGLGDFDSFREPQTDVLEWDTNESSVAISILGRFFQLIYFIVTIIILMNLLIAMMASTYEEVATQAVEEYQMQFSKLVKEYYFATILPVPFNIIEHVINAFGDLFGANTDPGNSSDYGGRVQLWGKHYTWPASTKFYDLQMAKKRYMVKQILAARKAGKKAKDM
eukprot:SAG11_NODE_410_length_9703_cov_3.284777_16_plen_207_part_00